MYEAISKGASGVAGDEPQLIEVLRLLRAQNESLQLAKQAAKDEVDLINKEMDELARQNLAHQKRRAATGAVVISDEEDDEDADDEE